MRPVISMITFLSNTVMRLSDRHGRRRSFDSARLSVPFPRNRLATAACLVFCSSLIGAPASAQDTPRPLVGGAILGAAAQSTAPMDRLNGVQTDLLFGRDQKGPYTLAWKNIRARSEQITRGGRTLVRDVDYTLDPASGILTFTTPLGTSEIVRVTYRNDTPDAVPNRATLAVPLQVDLWERGQNRLSLRTLIRPANGPNSEMDALTSLQLLNGARFHKTSELHSGLYMDLRGGDLIENGGFRLGERTRFRNADFAVTYSRAGTGFALEDVSGLKAGREVFETLGTLTPLQNLRFNTVFRQTSLLADPTKNIAETKIEEIGSAFAYLLPKNQGKIEGGRTQTTVTPAGSEGVVQTQDSVRVEGALGKATQASVGYEATASQPKNATGQGGSYTQKTNVLFTSRPDPRVQVTGAYQNALGTEGGQDTMGLRLESNPVLRLRQLRLIAAIEDRLRADGVRRSREAMLELPPIGGGKTQISGGVRQTSDAGQERLVGLINATSRPLRNVEITGGAQFREGTLAEGSPDPNAVDSYTLKMAMSPAQRLRLYGSLGLNPESGDGVIRRTRMRAVGLETELGSLRLRGQYGQEDEYLTTSLVNTLEMALDLRLSRFDSISAGLQTRSLYKSGWDETNTYLFSYTRRFGSLFDFSLSGAMTLRSQNHVTDWNNADMRADAKIGVRF